MVNRSEKILIFVFCLFVSLFLHLGSFIIFSPVIEKKATPLLVSWLDLLRPQDLNTVVSGDGVEGNFDREFLLRPSHPYLSYFREPFSFLTLERPLFVSKKTPQMKGKFLPFVFLKKISVEEFKFLPLSPGRVFYNVGGSSQGRVLLAVPLCLPEDSLTSLYIEKYLRRFLVFSKRRDFFWTNVEVVIK